MFTIFSWEAFSPWHKVTVYMYKGNYLRLHSCSWKFKFTDPSLGTFSLNFLVPLNFSVNMAPWIFGACWLHVLKPAQFLYSDSNIALLSILSEPKPPHFWYICFFGLFKVSCKGINQIYNVFGFLRITSWK